MWTSDFVAVGCAGPRTGYRSDREEHSPERADCETNFYRSGFTDNRVGIPDRQNDEILVRIGMEIDKEVRRLPAIIQPPQQVTQLMVAKLDKLHH
jgi:hypothetical protein